jgi:hypothetical protein
VLITVQFIYVFLIAFVATVIGQRLFPKARSDDRSERKAHRWFFFVFAAFSMTFALLTDESVAAAVLAWFGR